MATHKLDGRDARDLGVIQEVNRQLLHMRGMALWVDPQTGAMGIFVDDDPDGWNYAGEAWENESRGKAEAFDALIKTDRPIMLGYEVQPLPDA